MSLDTPGTTGIPLSQNVEDTQHGAWLSASKHEAEFGAAWLALQCEVIGSVLGAVLVMGPPETGPFLPCAFSPEDSEPTPLLAEVADLAMQGREPVTMQREGRAAIGYPLIVDNHLFGVVALEMSYVTDIAVHGVMRQLQWGAQGVASFVRQQQMQTGQATSERLMQTLDFVATAASESKFSEAAHALVTELAIRFSCDRVSMGFRKSQTTKVVAVSHSAQIGKRMNLIQAIESAMDEAIDQKSTLLLPVVGEQVLVLRDHAALARQHGSDSVLTIPFSCSKLAIGAFTFERSGTRAFSAQEIELSQAVVALSSRILEDKRLNDRGVALRSRDATAAVLRKLVGPNHFGLKAASLACMVATIALSFASGTYRVSANAVLEGSIRRVLVAPYDGYVETSQLRAGDVVKAGSVLAVLDQRDLQLEYLRWASQAEQFGKQSQEALAKSDRVQVNVTSTQIQQARAQMALLAEKLARAKITSPFDGMVVSGDLTQSLGGAVKRGQTLFEIAPLNAYRVILEVGEDDIDAIAVGQAGQLVLTALPDETLALTIKHLSPVTVAREGRSFYRVEAALDQGAERLRPGMEGLGKIEIGQRKYLWQWTHKMLNWIRLSLWSWM